jgi:hypothetical protein
MALDLERFFGGGENLGGSPSDLQVKTGAGRVLTVSGSGSIKLPPTTYKKPGFPHYIVVNSDVGSITIKDVAGSTIHTLTGSRLVFVGLKSDGTWEFGNNRTYDQGNDL